VIRVQLPPAEADRLDTLFRSTPDRKLRDRLQIALMAHRGRARRDIAADLGVNRRTVTRWVHAYCDHGLDGLRPKKAAGKAGHIPAGEVKPWVIDGPAEQGLDRAHWAHEEIADHLLKTHRIRTSRSAVQRFCSRIGIRRYRPTYRHLRGQPEKQVAARAELAALGSGRRPGRSSG
jgi:transposase